MSGRQSVPITFLVLFEHPRPGDLLDILKTREQPGMEDLGAIQALHEGVLVEFAHQRGLDLNRQGLAVEVIEHVERA